MNIETLIDSNISNESFKESRKVCVSSIEEHKDYYTIYLQNELLTDSYDIQDLDIKVESSLLHFNPYYISNENNVLTIYYTCYVLKELIELLYNQYLERIK